jgi:crotonobetainyl-CoA:carnitine CoA-transferase CaiB-like acyl-CoA transferase
VADPGLSGCRVIELGGYVAAPFAGHMLAYLGADVIKVEGPRGDPIRTSAWGGPSGTFIAYGGGKRSVGLDLTTADGGAVFERMLPEADVVLHNLAPDTARRMRVTYDDCARVKPSIVHCHIKAYGPGPREDDVASNPMIEASTGIMFEHRRGGRPTRLGPSYFDQFAGAFAVVGILAALRADANAAERRIEVGLYESALFVAAKDLLATQLDAAIPERGGSAPAEFDLAGYGAYQTSDGRWIYLLMLSDDHWRAFCRAMSLPELDDASLATRSERGRQRERVEAVVAAAIRGRTREEAIELLRRGGVGFSEVTPPDEVFDAPEARSPGRLLGVPYDDNRFEVPTIPIWGSGVRTEPGTPPPQLGQHTMAVMGELGYSRDECADLVARGVIHVAA